MKFTGIRSITTLLAHGFNVLALLAAVWYGFWLTSDGHFPNFHPYDNYYVDLSQAFQKGQVALLDLPDPRLASLADPHDAPGSNIPFLWDLSYYHGKYYAYWGPSPAIFYMIYSAIAGKTAPAPLGVLSAYTGIAILMLSFLYVLRRHFFPRAPLFSIGIFLLAACVSPPYAFLLARPLTYETAILSGQMFLLAGLFCWLLYLVHKKSWLLALAGLSWGLAVLARYDTLISALVYTGGVLLYLWQSRPAGRNTGKEYLARRTASLIAPLAACALAMEAYNALRFGSPFETGLRYQLTTPVTHYYSIHYLLSNLYVYLFYPNPVTHSYPFVAVRKFFPNFLPGWAVSIPGKQFDFGFFGLFRSTPVFWLEALAFLGLAAILVSRSVAQRGLQARPGLPAVQEPAPAQPIALQAAQQTVGPQAAMVEPAPAASAAWVPVTGESKVIRKIPGREYQPPARAREGLLTQPVRYLMGMLLLAGLLQLSFLLFYYYSAVRFLSDFFLPLLAAGFLAFWLLDTFLYEKRVLRTIFWIVLAFAALQTVAIGFLSGFTLFPYYFPRHNPQVYNAIRAAARRYQDVIYTFLKPDALPGLIVKALFHK